MKAVEEGQIISSWKAAGDLGKGHSWPITGWVYLESDAFFDMYLSYLLEYIFKP